MAINSKGSENYLHKGGNFMNGSVNLDKRTGKYSIKLYLEGKQVCICTDKYTGTSFTSKQHALKALGAIQLEIDEGVFKRDEWRKGTAVRRKTVKWYANIWLDYRIKMAVDGVLVASTVIDNHTNVNNYILPRFGKRLLSSITTKDILELKASINRSPSGVCNVFCTFQKLLNDAAAEGLIGSVPKFPSLAKRTLEPSCSRFGRCSVVDFVERASAWPVRVFKGST